MMSLLAQASRCGLRRLVRKRFDLPIPTYLSHNGACPLARSSLACWEDLPTNMYRTFRQVASTARPLGQACSGRQFAAEAAPKPAGDRGCLTADLSCC